MRLFYLFNDLFNGMKIYFIQQFGLILRSNFLLFFFCLFIFYPLKGSFTHLSCILYTSFLNQLINQILIFWQNFLIRVASSQSLKLLKFIMNYKRTLILSCLIVLSLHIRIYHDQISYRLGQNYGQGQITTTGSTTGAVSNCNITKPQVSPPKPVQQVEPIFQPVPVQPLTITCALPRVFSAATNTCQCLSQTVFDPQTNKCLCPPQKPLWNGKQCVKCADNMYFDLQQRQCYLCPQGFVHTLASGNKSRCQSNF